MNKRWGSHQFLWGSSDSKTQVWIWLRHPGYLHISLYTAGRVKLLPRGHSINPVESKEENSTLKAPLSHLEQTSQTSPPS